MPKSRKKRIGPCEVMDMLGDGLSEMEASGYEVAQSAASIGSPHPWWGADGEVPELLWWDGKRTMMFRMPDGSQVQVKATRVRSFTQQRN